MKPMDDAEGLTLRLPDGEPLEDELSFCEETYEDISTTGTRLTPEELAAFLPPGDGGVVIHVQLVMDDEEKIKARRPQPLPVHASAFLTHLVELPDGRWAYTGTGLNGWEALTCLEVRSVTAKSARKRMMSMMSAQPVTRVWEAPDRRDPDYAAPHTPAAAVEAHTKREPDATVRVTLRCAPWTLTGWSRDSPGCVWWYEKQSRPTALMGSSEEPGRVLCGAGMIGFAEKDGSDAECVRVHLLHHRYALPGGRAETTRDKMTWHSAALVEWRHADDRASFTVVELATLNGCSGRGGRANWHEDRNEAEPMLSRAMPRRMKAPWDTTRGEIRCHDVSATSLEAFKAFVEKHTGRLGRFLDPAFSHSHDVRLSFRRKTHVMQYLINYMGRDFRYNELSRNCQTFATDFYGFMASKGGMSCYSSIVDYTPRTHLFLYDFRMYENPNGVIEYSEKYARRVNDDKKKKKEKENK